MLSRIYSICIGIVTTGFLLSACDAPVEDNQQHAGEVTVEVIEEDLSLVIPDDDEFGAGWPLGEGRDDAGYLCGSCHSLAIVKQQGLSREDWDELLTWMSEEQGMMEVEGEERDLILDYLAAHFNQDRVLPSSP